MKKEPTSSALDLIARFVDVFTLPVEAHLREALRPEDEEALRKLAAGELDAQQRALIVPLLARNECALEFLASIVKEEG